jgi:AAA15 family ATPase/GTPase
MSLIERVEISYFRSLYKVDLRGIGDINIFSGSNDVGKSNMLKALNLFFNGFTDWGKEVDFHGDINRRRLREVRSESVKGKQIIWIAVTFRRPSSYEGSLPVTIRVKKKWDRYNEERRETNLETKEKHGDLPSTKDVAERFLTRFLNKIEFEYIPAVRGESFRVHLLNRLQNYLLKEQGGSPGLPQTVKKLAAHIDPKINKLKKDFERITGIRSTIAPPEDITSLFRAFNVSTGISGGHEIPLEQRGDGIQSQYLLSVLRHMCSSDRKYHIWAFEEPENSLEYSRVKQLASDLEDDCSESQIFITTHSPALVNMNTEASRVFRVHRDEKETSTVSFMSEFEKDRGLSTDIGIDKLKEDLYEDYKEKLDSIEALEQRVQKLDEINRHKILTEGKTDAKIIRVAFNKLRGEKPSFEVKEADPYSEDSNRSAGGAGMLSKFVETRWSSDEFKTIAVFDRDDEGRREFNNLSNNFKKWKDRDDVKIHNNGSAFGVMLPVPTFRSEAHQINIEKMFCNDVLKKKNSDGKGLTIKRPKPVQLRLDNGKGIDISEDDVNSNVLDDAMSDIEIISGKSIFANEIVPNLGKDEFQEFQKLFDLVEKILED